MGLSNHLSDVSSGSIPILLIAAAASFLSYLRSLLRLHPEPIPSSSSTSSGLAGLIVLADYLNHTRTFPYQLGDSAEEYCVVCLCGMKDGERVRRLSCCHVFHSDCLDGWFDQMKLSCPLCRSPPMAAMEERLADDESRIGAELVAWLSPY